MTDVDIGGRKFRLDAQYPLNEASAANQLLRGPKQ
jgi:hypothetical protein